MASADVLAHPAKEESFGMVLLEAMAWELARGNRCDAVVVLDGFNELVLSKLENADHGVNPFYPRGWRLRALDVAVAAIGELRRKIKVDAFTGTVA